jgi:hypothetical protein
VTADITDINTWRWPDVRRDAVERFGGELPGARLEAEVVDVFERSPRRVVEEIDAVARDLASGRIRSGWAVLRRRVEHTSPVRDVVAGDESEKQRRVARALRWISNAGLYSTGSRTSRASCSERRPPGRCRRTRATRRCANWSGGTGGRGGPGASGPRPRASGTRRRRRRGSAPSGGGSSRAGRRAPRIAA